MSEQLHYLRPVLLNRERHRHHHVKPGHDFGFVRKAHALYVAGVEFNDAGKDCAIVFARAGDDRVLPVVLLGLRAHENLFVDASGNWMGRYIPAYVRRYPFVLAQLPQQALAVCVDEAARGWNDPTGEALFDAQGASTAFLQSTLDFLQHYQQELARTEAFCAQLVQADLLVEMNARADLLDGRSFTLDGLWVVDEKRLMALSDEKVLALFRSGQLHWVAMHLASLSNMLLLVDRLAVQTALQPAPPP